MEIETSTVFTGPNIYSPGPVVRHTLEFPTGLPTERLTALFEALCTALPGLNENHCGVDAADFLSDHNSSVLNHLFEHVCIELQNATGTNLACARNANGAELDACEAIVAYEEADVCIEAARVSAQWWTEFLEIDSPEPDFTEVMESFYTFSERHTLPVQDRALIRSAQERNIPVTRLVGRTLQLGQGCRQQRLSGSKTSLTNAVGNDIAANKDYCRRLLAELGLPMPRYGRAYRSKSAVEIARKIGYPVVVKPNSGNLGHGVTVGAKSAREVRAAYKLAREYCRSTLVEEVINGADYRMLVIGGKMCAAAKREPAHVVGDGKQTIQELVAQVNEDPRRGVGARFPWTLVPLDNRADQLLAYLRYTRDSVPKKGETVYLRRNANTSDGGLAIDLTDEVHPDNRDIAVSAALAVGLDIAGVDILTTDISVSMWENGGVICEINSRPGLRKHMWPSIGQPRDVTGPVVDMLFPEETTGRILTAAVTGDGNRNAVARILAHLLSASGRYVGLVTMGQALIDGHTIKRPELSLPEATRAILVDPRVDALVIDADPLEVREHGLGNDTCEACVVIECDLPGDTPEEMINPIGVVARTAHHIVLSGTLSLPCDLGTGAQHYANINKDSATPNPWIEIVRNRRGIATHIRVNDEPLISIALDAKLKLLTGVPDEIEETAILHACAAALLLGIDAETIERCLPDFNNGSYAE